MTDKTNTTDDSPTSRMIFFGGGGGDWKGRFVPTHPPSSMGVLTEGNLHFLGLVLNKFAWFSKARSCVPIRQSGRTMNQFVLASAFINY